ATSRNLEEDAAAGRFREDLFFRLNVFALLLPPLRERLDDLPLLIEHFLARFAQKFGKAMPIIAPEAMAVLNSYAWPGNVRELENALERAVILCEGDVISSKLLPERITGRLAADTASLITGESLSIRRTGESMERELIRRALESTG